jgi:hypothetical protein
MTAQPLAQVPDGVELVAEPRPRAAAAATVFTVAIFANAALLFTLEPMFTKMVLPLLGGTPSVWNTCLLFFQAVLLGGYLYAHLATRHLPARGQAGLHLALVAVAALVLPVAVPAGWQPPPTGSPVPWLLAALAVALGLPFLVLSAGAPLLQRWFARTGHPDAADPYFLYAASNAGSLVALLAYPLLVEPNLRLSEQSRLWAAAYVALALLLAACAVLARGARAGAAGVAAAGAAPELSAVAAPAEAARSEPIGWRRVARWVLLAFVPSSLLLGTTSYLSTDVASVPLLWVVPLALYLLSFVFVFARRQVFRRAAMLRVQAIFLVPLATMLLSGSTRPLWLLAAVHLLTLFATAMVCHGELAATRPRADRLTEFYLWMSAGGVLGGVFNVLVAPVVFDSVVEYPLVIVLACLLRPNEGPGGAGEGEGEGEGEDPARARLRLWRARVLDVVLPLLLFGAVVAILQPDFLPERLGKTRVHVATGVLGLLCFFLRTRPLRFALGVTALLVGGYVGRRTSSDDTLFRARSFFGVYRVRGDSTYRMLVNGTTLHGAQLLAPKYRKEPLTYYHVEGPLGQLFLNVVQGKPPIRVAAVGLGAGTMGCYARPGDQWTFYEIDPLVVRIARDPHFFTYLRDCVPTARVVLGDARRSLSRAPDGAYDLILLDAFSSDAIPVHLLTREALDLYLRKLAPGGLIAFHVSNRHLDLRPVLTEIARDARVAGASGGDVQFTAAQNRMLKSVSTWVVVARHATDFAALVRQPGWAPLPPRADVRMWTDDASDLVGVFKWR